MHLEWLELRDFRCHEDLSLRAGPAVNLLVGPNGAGKTSILEAAAYLSRLSSFRGSPDDALVRSGETAAVIRGEFRDVSQHLVEVELPVGSRRRVLFDGKRPARYSDVAAMIRTVAFLPDDLDVVKRGPGLRRDYVDDVAVRVWPAASGEQSAFERAVRQRNALLREHGHEVSPEELDVWDRKVAATGSAVMKRRLEVLAELQPVMSRVYRELDPIGEELDWSYVTKIGEREDLEPNASALEAALLAALQQRRRVDLDRRVTTVGPHRDEPGFLIAGRDVRTRASQGEQRSVALTLRIAAFDLISARVGDTPILLLDDVFSELDAGRADALVRRLPSAQVFVTSARPEDVPLDGIVWTIDHGKVSA